MSSWRFSYQPRLDCACGAALDAAGPCLARAYPPGEVRFRQCPQCRSWCQSPQITLAALTRWFDSGAYQGGGAAPGLIYADYEADEAARVREARHRYKHELRSQVQRETGKILEIGCASASLLSVFKQEGWQVAGVDLSARFAEAARRHHGIDVIVGDLESASFPEGAFDAILLFGTVSAFLDPAEQLARMRRLLRPGGRLFLNFPDASSPLVRWIYRSRFWMFTPSVSCFYSRQGVRHLLARTGFRLEALRHDSQQPSYANLFMRAGLPRVASAASRVLGAGAAFPWSLPLPAIYFARASPA